MMSKLYCAECQQWLHPYLDNELGTEMAVRVQVHLEACPQCKSEYESLRGLQQGIREHAPRYDMPELTQHRILSKLPTQFTHWFMPAASLAALAASVMLFIASPSEQNALIDEVVSSHIRSLQEQHLMDVVSTDKHTVKPWFAGKLDFSPPVFDFAEQGYPLIGGRLDYIHHQNAAALSYKRNKHVINLFITPSSEVDCAAAATSQRGYNIVSWRKNHMAFEAVSDLNAKELGEFSKFSSNQ